MKKAILFLLSVMLILSCEKEGKKEPLKENKQFDFECFTGLLPVDLTSSTPCDTTDFNDDFYCEKICQDTIYSLNQAAKEWFPFFCLESSDRIYYHDFDNNQTFFEIKEREYVIQATDFVAYPDTCADGLRKLICFNAEKAVVTFRSDLLGNEFDITLFSGSSVYLFNQTVPGTSIGIGQRVDLLPGLTSLSDFHASIEEDGSLTPFSFNIESFSKIEILGRIFEDVVTYRNPFSEDDGVKFFYNKKYGIVSFIDRSGKQWVINE